MDSRRHALRFFSLTYDFIAAHYFHAAPAIFRAAYADSGRGGYSGGAMETRPRHGAGSARHAREGLRVQHHPEADAVDERKGAAGADGAVPVARLRTGGPAGGDAEADRGGPAEARVCR